MPESKSPPLKTEPKTTQSSNPETPQPPPDTQQPDQSETKLPTQPPPSKPKRTSIIILITCALLTLGIISLLAYKQLQSKKITSTPKPANTTSSPTPTQLISCKNDSDCPQPMCISRKEICTQEKCTTCTPTKCTDGKCQPDYSSITKDWKTYTNYKFGFSFSYPKSWISYKDEVSFKLVNINTNINSGYIEGPLEPGQPITFKLFVGVVSTSVFSDWQKSVPNNNIKIESLKIGGHRAHKTSNFPEGSLESLDTFVEIENNKHLQVTLWPYFKTPLNNNQESLREQYNQILSTFKFLKSDNRPKVDWNTYSDTSKWLYFNKNYYISPKRDFRFKYPALFNVDNQDSGAVWLVVGIEKYLAIEQMTSFKTNEGTTNLEKLKSRYAQVNSGNELIDENVELIVSQGETVVYKITESSNNGCGGGFYNESFHNQHTWYCYYGSVGDRGFNIAQFKEISDQTVSDLLLSIEFSPI